MDDALLLHSLFFFCEPGRPFFEPKNHSSEPFCNKLY